MKVAVLTGSSSGLGLAVYEHLLHQMDMLICLARRFTDAQLSKAKQYSSSLKLIRLDLADTQNDKLWHTVERSLRDVLSTKILNEIIFINNSGVIEPIGRVGALDRSQVLSSVSVNLVSPIIIANYLAQIAREKGAKLKVVNISSGAANRPIAGWALYCSAKAGAKMFFDVMKETNDVEVCHVDPGVVDTNMQSIIRQKSKEEFPQVEYCIALKNQKNLRNPNAAALEIIEKYILT